MLCDDITNDADLTLDYEGLELIYTKIRQAAKFILRADFAAAADGLVENYDELGRIVPYCKLPYPITWIEFAHDDRPHWNPEGSHGARPIDPARGQSAPKRVGYLLVQQGDDAGRFDAYLAWSFKHTADVPHRHNVSLMVQEFTVAKAAEAVDPLEAVISTRLADFGEAVMDRMPMSIVKTMVEYAHEDWGGEVRFLVAVLGLLNTRNVVTADVVDNTTMNRKRARHGQRELFSHTVVKIRTSLTVRGSRVASDDHRAVRFHFVRGHFKRRASGLYWWSRHGRGKVKHGTVTKDYELHK